MGMFDSFYDTVGGEWQTKALGQCLDQYGIGDAVPGPPIDYQMKVLGGPDGGPWEYAYATIREGDLASLPDERDESLPLRDYFDGWLPRGT